MHKNKKNLLSTRKKVVIIDKRTVIRESLLIMLKSSTKGMIFFSFDNISDMSNKIDISSTEELLLLLNIGEVIISIEILESRVKMLQNSFPKASIVVMADNESLLNLSLFFLLKLKGFIVTTVTPAEFYAALQLVLAGGEYIPKGFLLEHDIRYRTSSQNSCNHSDILLENKKLFNTKNFTRRQMEVLEMLYHGLSNKIIAYQLDISESTVKVHVRDIMKKLEVRNRTQAAYLVSSLFVE